MSGPNPWPPGTVGSALWELGAALNDLFDAFVEEIGIVRFLDWLHSKFFDK